MTLNPLCLPREYTHGGTERAVVLFHGFTNCPQMWENFGRRLFELGNNVFIPRLPHHGLADRLTREPALLSATELRDCADEAVEMASGLGEKVTVAGISLGAVLAAHLAMTSDLVDRSVVIAPYFGAPRMHESVSDLIGFAAWSVLPDLFVWWDWRAKAGIVGPKHGYPGFSSRAYGAMLQLGHQVRCAARRERPRVTDLRMVLNAADPAVNNAVSESLAENWRRHGGRVQVHVFAKELGLLHDLVSEDQVGQRTDLVYPVLQEQITRAAVTSDRR